MHLTHVITPIPPPTALAMDSTPHLSRRTQTRCQKMVGRDEETSYEHIKGDICTG